MRKKSGEERQLISSKFGLRSSEPLVCFALCTGAFSDPMVISFFNYIYFYTVMQLEYINHVLSLVSWFRHKLPMYFQLKLFSEVYFFSAQYGIVSIYSQLLVVEIQVKLHWLQLQCNLIGLWMPCWNLNDFLILYLLFVCLFTVWFRIPVSIASTCNDLLGFHVRYFKLRDSLHPNSQSNLKGKIITNDHKKNLEVFLNQKVKILQLGKNVIFSITLLNQLLA